jgi:putative spermidine/putrescine transport system ATP-binding protein
VSAISLEGISKSYGDVRALDDVDLAVADGEFVTILGPSGSGKTTMLLAISGFEQPDRGSILFGDEDVTERPPHRRKVGLVFQSYALFPHMSVYRNVAFPLRVRRTDRGETRRRVDQALRRVRLEGFEQRRPHQLSGGQQQRVAVARAIVFEPHILLLDEPLAALDRQLRQTVQVELRELQRSLGITTISVTHDQEEALTMSDRVLVLRDGEVQQFGTPQDVYSRPRNRFVAGFLGSANLLDGGLEDRDGRRHFVSVAGTAFAVRPDAESPSGARATAMIRPERLAIEPAGEVGSSDAITAVVTGAVYLGSGWRYRARTLRGDMIDVLESSPVPIGVGSDVLVRHRPDDVWLLPAHDDADGSSADPPTTDAAGGPGPAR